MTEHTLVPAPPPGPDRPNGRTGPTGSVGASESTGAAAAATIVTVVLAGAALIVGARLTPIATVAAVGVVQAVLVLTWVGGFGVPGRIGALLMGLAAAGGADAVLVRWNTTGYEPVLAVLGLALPVMFVHQLVRGVMRSRVVESLADIAVVLLGVTALAGLIVLRYQDNGRALTTAVVAAAGLGLLVDQLTDLGLPVLRFDADVARGLPGVVLGVVAGAAAGAVVLRHDSDFTTSRAVFAGAATAVVACLISIGTSFAGTSTAFSKPPVPMGPRAVPDDAGSGNSGEADDDDDDRLQARRPGNRRLRPIASVLLTLALTTPAGYVLATSLAT